MISIRLYQALLRLYPPDFLASFGTEMLDTFANAEEERRAEGRLRHARFVLSELAGLGIGISAEWVSKWFGGARRRSAIAGSRLCDEKSQTEEQLEKIIALMVRAIANHDFPKARSYSELERAVRERLRRSEESRGSTP